MTPAEKLAEALAWKASELTNGMLTRVKRHPDKADFYAAFLPIVAKQLQKLEEEIQAEVDCRDPSVD